MIDSYLKKQMDPKNMVNTALENMEDDFQNLIPRIRAFPQKIDNIVQQVVNGKLTFRMSLFADDDNVRFINSALS